MLGAGATEEKGETARMVCTASKFAEHYQWTYHYSQIRGPTGCACMQAAFVGAMAIADLVKTTLGPKGMVRSSPHCSPYSAA